MMHLRKEISQRPALVATFLALLLAIGMFAGELMMRVSLPLHGAADANVLRELPSSQPSVRSKVTKKKPATKSEVRKRLELRKAGRGR
jgi:hypothetical protein